MLEEEADTRGDEHAATAEGRAQAHAPDGFDAIAIEPDRREMRLSGRAELNGGHQVILEPAAQAVEGEIVPLLHANAQIAEDAQGGLGVGALPQMPAEIEEEVGFFTRNGSTIAQQFIDHLQRAALAAMRWPAFGGDGSGADLGIHENGVRV